MSLLNKKGLAVGAVALMVVTAAVVVFTDRPGDDFGGVASSKVDGGAPSPKNDPMSAVKPEEASKRATANAGAAREAQAADRSYVAPPVIAATEGARKGELPEPVAGPPPAPAAAPVAAPPAEPARMAMPTITQTQIVYAYPQPLADQDLRQKVIAQIDTILKPPSGGFVTRSFAKDTTGAGAAAGPGAAPALKATNAIAAASSILAARSGDVAYAALDRGFNSVDPQAPIFATIYDYRDDGRVGPLHGARALGQITYNRDQAAVTFSMLILPSGYQQPIKAIGISETDGRTGVAQNVDQHTLERYSGALVAGLIQGVGQVGQQLISNNQSYTVSSGGVLTTQSQPTTLLQAGMAAVQPLGAALSATAAASFSRPATISSPPGAGLGLVFLEPLQLPLEQIQRSQSILQASQR